jgi:beta-lactamase regulating signal transducer with metallopeptidase domain
MTTAVLNLNEIARISAGRMANCILEGIAIGLFAWALLHVVGRRNSSTRFAVWFSSLLGIASMPVFSVVGSDAVGAGNSASAITVPSSWALVIFCFWVMATGIALARVAVGLWQLRKLRQSCTAIDAASLGPVLQGTLQSFHAVRSVTLCQSDRLHVPTAIGFLKPMVVIPVWAMQELSTSELNSILIHELAHLRRWDDWTNLAQQVVKALFFFHPAVWWIESKLALEREMACDDAVLAETANPRGYAQCLISIAEKSFMRRGLALAQAAVNRVRQTSQRVSQILDVNRSGATQVWKPALYSVAGFSIICLVSLSHAPELVAFEDKAPSTAASGMAPSTVPVSAAASSLFSRNVIVTAVSMPAKGAGLTTHPSKSVLARRIIPRHDAAKPIEANFHQSRTDNLVQPVPAAFIEDAEAAPQTILMVMQSEQYAQAGPMLWRMCVWRVIVFDASHIRSDTRIPAKRI